jgi:hypothetical protein
MGLYMRAGVMFERSVMTAVQGDEDGHDLAEGQPCSPRTVAMARSEEVPREDWFKLFAEIIDIAEHCHELQLAHRDPLVLALIRDWINQHERVLLFCQ